MKKVNLVIHLQLPYTLIIVPRLVKMYPLFTNPMCSTICSLECSHSRLDLQICSPDKSTTSQRGLTFKADSTLLFQLSQEQVTGSSPLQPQSSQCSGLSSLACWPLLLCLLRKQCWADACNLNLELNWWKFLRASPCGIQPCPHGHVCKELALQRCLLALCPLCPLFPKHYTIICPYWPCQFCVKPSCRKPKGQWRSSLKQLQHKCSSGNERMKSELQNLLSHACRKWGVQNDLSWLGPL